MRSPNGLTAERSRLLSRRELLGLSAGLGMAGLAGCVRDDWSSGSGPDSTEELPATGTIPDELRSFETTVREFMVENSIPGGALGVAREREVLVERGYGFRDPDLSEPVTPETLFRLASLSKAFTRVAIRKLFETGELERSQPAFDLLGYEPLPGESYNERLDEVTVGHLLDHRGGWDRGEAYDPLFTQLDIALEREWEEPPTERQLVRYMLSEPLQFEPGGRSAYSNFGYLVLGHAVEAVTGREYEEYVRSEILDQLGVSEVYPGRSLPADRPDRETWYFDGRGCRNVADMNPLELVRCPDGGFQQEIAVASGGFVATVGAFLAFMSGYWLDGRSRDGDAAQSWTFNGTLPGTFTLAIQHQHVDAVVLFNQRGYDPNYHRIRGELRTAIDEAAEWPE